jgi:hypothetical protein
LRHERSFEIPIGKLAEQLRILAGIPPRPHAIAFAEVELTLGHDVAGRRVHLPSAMIDVIAVVVERDLALDPYFAVKVTFAHKLDFAGNAGLGLYFRIVGRSNVTEQRNWQSGRHLQFALLFRPRGCVQSHRDGQRHAAGC